MHSHEHRPEPDRHPLGDESADAHERVDPYAGEQPLWSGAPNAALVDEVSPLPPGHAVDVGSGEGADAVWLAQRGWRVIRLEPSATAQQRARAAAERAGVHVDWLESTLLDARLPPAGFDLVTCCYPALFRTREHRAEATLTGLVAPGGTLVLLTHADVDRDRALAHGFDPDDYVDHAAIRDSLGRGWSVVTDERRARHISGGGGAHHDTDLVLAARRDGTLASG